MRLRPPASDLAGNFVIIKNLLNFYWERVPNQFKIQNAEFKIQSIEFLIGHFECKKAYGKFERSWNV
ncbi:hypothetical protein ACE1CB_17845 [Aerosakkonema sp. BLCC-F2]